MPNTREVMGEQACLDALVADTLTSFEDDGVTKISNYGLYKHNALVGVKFTNCKSIENSGLNQCENLEAVEILGKGSGYVVNSLGLAQCKKLKHLVVNYSGPGIGSILDYSFSGTPIYINYGAIYVPDAKVSAYKADSSWGKYTILPTSEYPKSNLPETVSDTWAQIAAASQDGTYASKYAVGDIKSIDIGGTTYHVQLVAKDADVLASDGVTTAPMTWMLFKKVYGDARSMGGNGEWMNSDMRSWLSGTVLPLLPSDVQGAIKEVRKYSNAYVSGALAHDKQTTDKLWIPSAREIFGGSSYEQTGPIYSGVFADAESCMMYDSDISTKSYWLRTAYSGTQYIEATNAGGAFYVTQSTKVDVVFGFCI